MLSIPCPWCGTATRPSSTTAARPASRTQRDPMASSDGEWAEYVFMRDNPKGWFAERWFHTAGCRRWFNRQRHTVTNEIRR